MAKANHGHWQEPIVSGNNGYGIQGLHILEGRMCKIFLQYNKNFKPLGRVK